MVMLMLRLTQVRFTIILTGKLNQRYPASHKCFRSDRGRSHRLPGSEQSNAKVHKRNNERRSLQQIQDYCAAETPSGKEHRYDCGDRERDKV